MHFCVRVDNLPLPIDEGITSLRWLFDRVYSRRWRATFFWF